MNLKGFSIRFERLLRRPPGPRIQPRRCLPKPKTTELELIENSESTMVVEWEHDHKVHVSYYFSAHIKEDLPIYMENLMGMLTKKMFYRVKTFIENMKI